MIVMMTIVMMTIVMTTIEMMTNPTTPVVATDVLIWSLLPMDT